MANGKLVKHFEVRFPVELCYFLVCPEGTAHAPMISASRTWLLSQKAAATGTGA